MLTFLLLCVIVVAYYVRKFYSELKKYPPGPTPLPLIGNLHQLNINKPDATLTEWSKIYGPIFTVHLPTPNVIITGAKEIREALVKNGDAFSGRPHTPLIRFMSGADGVIFSDGARWSARRRFALRTLRDLGIGTKSIEAKIVKQAEGVAAAFCAHSESSGPLDPTEPLNLAVGNIIAEVLFGRLLGDATMRTVKGYIDNHAHLCFDWPVRLWETIPWITKVPILGNFHHKTMTDNLQRMHDVLAREIALTQVAAKERSEHDEPENFIECYLEQMKMERREHLINELFTYRDLLCTTTEFMSAGMETAVTTLRWALVLLAQHKDVQQRCRDELRRAIIDEGRQLGMALRNHTPYLIATIHEIQRVGNIVPVNIQHRVMHDVTVGGEGGHRLAAGTTVIPQVASAMADDRLFPRPGEFDPDRFVVDHNANSLEDDLVGKFAQGKECAEADGGQPQVNSAHNVIPFALGKRACAGEALARSELYIILAKLVSEFDIDVGTAPSDMDGVMGATRPPKHYTIRVKALD